MKNVLGFGQFQQRGPFCLLIMENRPNVRLSLSFLREILNWPIDPYPFAVDEAFDAYRLIVESCEFHDLLITIYFLIL